ncbi:MAG: flagellar biosynthesis anti-sigma factor FlgM [Novosphingobium sp.]|nr:flagellar biosynthesis anti-sigma factor FlgM [Novosphingobium sp.]MCP5401054.1 flagellar biosynthesis anti-sigma factor FlgM [Novosphingobium sp.]
MRDIELGPVRPVGAVDVKIARQASGQAKPEKSSGEEVSAPVVKSEALDPGQAPVDVERVQLIRRAIEAGDYPLVPTKIADAMIAAGILLRGGK